MSTRLGIVLGLVILLCTAVFVPAWAASSKTVAVGDNFFVRAGSKPTVSVKHGTTVRFQWTGSKMHDVISKGPEKFTSPLKSSGVYKHTFKKKGTYKIYCALHMPGMAMKLVVK